MVSLSHVADLSHFQSLLELDPLYYVTQLGGNSSPRNSLTSLVVSPLNELHSGRSTAPLAMAADAALLDTSFLSIEASVQRAIALVDARTAR